MSSFPEGYGRGAWEPEQESSGTTLEQPLPRLVPVASTARVVVITGGATGLGRSIAIEFARQGYRVAFCFVDLSGRDVTEQALLTETTCSAMGAEVYAARCDVRDRAQVERFLFDTVARFGTVHCLINNAGIAMDGAIWRMADEAWRAVLDTNVTGAFNFIRTVAPIYRKQRFGKIVSVSAHQAGRPGFGVANYAASKAALEGLTRAAAVELGPANVNVNAVAPGFIRTERMMMLPADVIDRARKHSVLGRVAEPEDVAHVISFLCSDEARHITGQTLVVDGGLSLE